MTDEEENLRTVADFLKAKATTYLAKATTAEGLKNRLRAFSPPKAG